MCLEDRWMLLHGLAKYSTSLEDCGMPVHGVAEYNKREAGIAEIADKQYSFMEAPAAGGHGPYSDLLRA